MPTGAQEFVEVRRGQFYPKADTLLAESTLRGLDERSPQASLEQVRAAFAHAGISAPSVTRMEATGTFHELYSCTAADRSRFVLKANRMSDRLVDFSLATEMSVSRALVARGIPHAEFTGVDLSRKIVPFDYGIMTFVDGESFRDFDLNEPEVMRRLPELARYLKKCHTVAGSGFGLIATSDESGTALSGSHLRWHDYLLVRAEEHIAAVLDAGLISDDEVTDIREAFSELQSMELVSRPRLLHGDCGPHNAIVTGAGSIAMIDWEDALLGDPLFEIAMWATFNPVRRWSAFFESYFGSAWSPDRVFWLYFLRIALAKSVVRLRFGYRDVPGRPPASARIQQALTNLRPR